jgi:RNA polymerase sigma-70 factor (ECF subfamily)
MHIDFEFALERATEQAQRILGDRASAEDVASEAVTRIAEGADAEHLGLIVHGLAVDEYRRRGKEFPVDAQVLLDTLDQVDAWTIEDVRFHADFDRAVRVLPEPERDAFILTDLRGLTQREAADVLDTSQMTTQRRAERARQTIREEILDG